MRIALSTAHARWWPHRSGYQYARPSYRPDEYEHSRRINHDLAAVLTAEGHTVRTFEKFEVGQDCRGACAGNPKRCGRYAAAVVNVCHEIDTWQPDLAVEFHINNGAAGNHGAFALVNDSDLAEAWATNWLGAYTSTTPIGQFGQGVWRYVKPYKLCPAARVWGAKWAIAHAGPAVVLVECGFASSASDSAYLQTDASVEAAVVAAVLASSGVTSG